MKNDRTWWRVYVPCSLAILLALGWITKTFLGLEEAERGARMESEIQSSLRLALWRIDSWLGPLLALEAARPYSEYLTEQTSGGLEGSPGFVLVHFQIDSLGVLASPEVAESTAGRAQIEEARSHLATVHEIFRKQDIESRVLESERTQQRLRLRVPESDLALDLESSDARSDLELSKRQGAVQQLAETQCQVANSFPAGDAPGAPRVGTFLPVWFEAEDSGRPHLVFLRRVVLGPESHFQGFLCSWPELEAGMLDQINDLFPQCEIRPIGVVDRVTQPDPIDVERGSMLATVPASLIVPLRAAVGGDALSATRITLGFSWLAVLVGLVAVALAFRSTVALAQKQARFAVAVTHELRTPLTTFRMYTDMLSQGMVTDPGQREEYIGTLHDESERLARLVENVLAYAQLEEGRRRSQIETVSVGDLLDRLADPLVRRAEGAGLEIAFDPGSCRNVRVQTDVDAVGHILLNLVDNACKYAGASSEKPLGVRCRDRGNSLALEVVDHGKGISVDQTAMVFTPFERGPMTLDRPGIGLGLALARGLARDLGGELRLLPGAGHGACFELTIPK